MVGSHKQLTKPALEFVKVVCNVLALDPVVESEVRGLDRAEPGTAGVATEVGLERPHPDRGHGLLLCLTWRQVVVMRRQLLAKLRVREFADEGLSTDYCRSVPEAAVP